MKQFKYIKVAEDIYDISWEDLVDEQGITDCDKKTISLDPDILKYAPSARIQVFLHEIAHAVASHFGLDGYYQHKPTNETMVVFERIIDTSAKGLLMVMVDNPEFFRWIMDTIKKEEKKWQRSQAPKQKRSKKQPRHLQLRKTKGQ